ncbi:hypothetical protein H7F36_06635 [Variovorax sp. PAMC28562]|uniref:hypothetical protein n=1 Tax=Variovorax sp. PAMC28562 TaxID=2762323 RepID=UPI00164DF518|nr:hypothetical protein [Variovorax sp. PAMC28562]QNK74891.1 hypothetical protein H7F36_06635 [Variovorax sp. PAMC28562]
MPHGALLCCLIALVASQALASIEDRGFPKVEMVLASLHGRQPPLIAYAFTEFLGEELRALK